MCRLLYILILSVIIFAGCEWKLKFGGNDPSASSITVDRYDRIESLYLTTGDFSALQHMNTGYPMQTRTLIEDVLKIGKVNDPEINSAFLNFYQDTILQNLITDVEFEFANMDDINRDLSASFGRLQSDMPNIEIPDIYAQIGALDQSIIVGNNILGISLDKYLGADYPLYKRYYNESQRTSMSRSMIVPDCLSFYLLSIYPMPFDRELSQFEHDMHMGKIQWVVNKALQKKVFNNKYVSIVEKFMNNHKETTMEQLLLNNDYAALARR